MPHTIDLDEMLAWIEKETTTYASSSREKKTLEVKLSSGYRVTVRGETIYDGTDGRTAVTKYNEAV